MDECSMAFRDIYTNGMPGLCHLLAGMLCAVPNLRNCIRIHPIATQILRKRAMSQKTLLQAIKEDHEEVSRGLASFNLPIDILS